MSESQRLLLEADGVVSLGALVAAVWVRRRSRFVVEVRLEDGRRSFAHTNNTGTMRSANTPGNRVWLRPAASPERKLPYSLVLVEAHIEGDKALGRAVEDSPAYRRCCFRGFRRPAFRWGRALRSGSH